MSSDLSAKHRAAKKAWKKGSPKQSLATDSILPLAKFQQVQVPDVTAIKFVYSDFRNVASVGYQGEYVYRINSLFDCDQTGVGGQPDGFDLWKTLYSQYRVIACLAEVQCVGFSGIGFVAMAPSPNSAVFGSAEEVAGLRKSKGGIFTLGQGAVTKLTRMYRISQCNGISDESLLANDSFAATTTSNPSRVTFLHVATETAGAIDSVYIWVKLTYFARLENAADTLDSSRRHARQIALLASQPAGAKTTHPLGIPATTPTLSSAVVPVTTDVNDRLRRLLRERALERLLDAEASTDVACVTLSK